MKALRATLLILCLLFPGAAVAAPDDSPQSAPCAPGAVYDPACDVDHDGDVDIFDIQLAAGHWNQRGTWVSDNGHNHLGQTWTGNNRLAIQGSYGFPAVAPLVLTNSGSGDGLWITGAGFSGVTVSAAGTDGVYVGAAGNPSSQSSSNLKNGFEVAGAENNGLHVGAADQSGVYVNSAGGSGLRVITAGGNGVAVETAGGYGMHIDSAGVNGVTVESAGFDGVVVGMAGNPTVTSFSNRKNGFEVAGAEGHGLYVGHSDFSGVFINSTDATGVYIGSTNAIGVFVGSSGGVGVWADTALANGEWGLFTPDKISGSNITLSSVTIVAQVAGEQALYPGDVAAASGVADPLPGSTVPLALVRLADAGSQQGVVGVVEGRMALTPHPQLGGEAGQDPALELRSAAGAAQPGDYVALTVLGVAQVKVEAGAAIEPGQRLVGSTAPGRARPLRTVEVDGVRLAEDAPAIGVALAAPAPGQDAIPVFVTLR